MEKTLARLRQFSRDARFLLPVTAAAILIHGYHPGAEDDGVYLAAIQHRLNPGLFPHDWQFITLQTQATIFDTVMAWMVRATHMPVDAFMFLAQIVSIAAILWGCLRVARACFPACRRAECAAVWSVAALLTLGVAGTAIMIADQHLHPRTVAAALLLAMTADLLAPATWLRRLRAAGLLLLAALFHPIMGAFGLTFFCAFWFAEPDNRERVFERLEGLGLIGEARAGFGLGILAMARKPLEWISDPPSADWRAAMSSRRYLHLQQWHWYEVLGLVAPFFILWWLQRLSKRQGRDTLNLLLRSLLIYYVFQMLVVFPVLQLPMFERLLPLQPLRFLHLIYLFMVLIAGGLTGEYLYRRAGWQRATALGILAVLAGTMAYAQRQLFPRDTHVELPGITPNNPWTQAFQWIRASTPEDAYFALPPRYMDYAGEGEHGFRALALRSVLADELKDAGVAMQVPRLATAWRAQTEALRGWQQFTREDFLRLKQQTGVDWALVAGKPIAGMPCPYQNDAVSVCRIE